MARLFYKFVFRLLAFMCAVEVGLSLPRQEGAMKARAEKFVKQYQRQENGVSDETQKLNEELKEQQAMIKAIESRIDDMALSQADFSKRVQQLEDLSERLRNLELVVLSQYATTVKPIARTHQKHLDEDEATIPMTTQEEMEWTTQEAATEPEQDENERREMTGEVAREVLGENMGQDDTQDLNEEFEEQRDMIEAIENRIVAVALSQDALLERVEQLEDLSERLRNLERVVLNQYAATTTLKPTARTHQKNFNMKVDEEEATIPMTTVEEMESATQEAKPEQDGNERREMTGEVASEVQELSEDLEEQRIKIEKIKASIVAMALSQDDLSERVRNVEDLSKRLRNLEHLVHNAMAATAKPASRTHQKIFEEEATVPMTIQEEMVPSTQETTTMAGDEEREIVHGVRMWKEGALWRRYQKRA